ncbi:putative epoxide hydrolase [Cladorrhinum sp. PSN332]|nr:putative epoxide hydrolase [Cladorrhinum sp. PSN332]
MAVDKLTPTDSRVTHHTVTLPSSRGSRVYHYLLANPPSSSNPPAGTILLVHGFPDLSFGWRYQIPFLLSLNLRVVVPDMIGYGRTSSPASPAHYSYKSVCDDLAALVKLAVPDEPQILIGGHDWGGAVVWRMCLWYPSLIKAVFSVCTPYTPPSPQFVDKKTVVSAVLPNFGYQIQFEDPALEEKVTSQGRAGIRKFLSCLYGARANGRPAMTGEKGIPLELFEGEQIGKSPLLSDDELEFYVSEYERNGVHGPLNWYRTWEVNFDEERELVEQGRLKIAQPALIVTASRDIALPPAMAAGMDKWCDKLTRRGVECSHWAIWEKPAEVNKWVGEFLGRVLKGDGEGKVKASI